MISEKEIKKALGKHRSKLMSVDFDGCGFTVWLKEPYVFSANQAGCLGWDYDQLEEAGGKRACIDELSMGVCTE